MTKTKVLLIGAGAREHALGWALTKNPDVQLHVIASNENPGLKELAQVYVADCRERDVPRILQCVNEWNIDMAVIGLEDPLDTTLVDELQEIGIPVVGPNRRAAKLETSKRYFRELMTRFQIPGSVDYRHFTDADAAEAYIRESGREFAVKPFGLTAGKGVKVMGEQLLSLDAAARYAREVIETKIGGEGGEVGVILEERLLGEEFTLQCFVDAQSIVPMPLVKDYKRAYRDDTGPNTGSMGSYSQADGRMDWLSDIEHREAFDIISRIVGALRSQGLIYKGILYGQFILTKNGLRLIETNARFGDPEAMNVLSLLETDFFDICRAIAQDELGKLPITFAHKATVCKYIVPKGYPDHPEIGSILWIDSEKIEAAGVQVRFAKVTGNGHEVRTSKSRSIALIAVAETLEEAHAAIEAAIENYIHPKENFYWRDDIGTKELIQKSQLIAAH